MSKLGKPKFNPRNTFDPALRRVSSASSVGQAPAVRDALALAALYHPPLHPLQYETAAPAPFRTAHAAHERTADELFISDELRAELAARNETTLQILPVSNLPEFVHVYHSLMPLDLGNGHKDRLAFGRACYRYKAVSHQDGRTYCLLRIDGFDAGGDERRVRLVNRWTRVASAGVVGVVEAFTTAAFGAPALVVVHEFWPLSRRLSELAHASESTLFEIAAQLFVAVQAVHRRGLAARVVNEQFVLLSGESRVRLGSVGVLDVLEPRADLDSAQAQDFVDLAGVLHRLARGAASAGRRALETALRAGDTALAESLLAPHLAALADAALTRVDALESDLGRELANARLVRLLAKLEFVLARTAVDPRGERYPLVLFHEYVFAQRTADGRPSLNLAHALAALNKLDAGVDENVLLTDSHGTRLVVSYKDLKAKFSYAFDLMASEHGRKAA